MSNWFYWVIGAILLVGFAVWRWLASHANKYHIDSVVNAPLLSNGSVYLSVIVPAYNEQERLPVMLDETIKHLQSKLRADSAFTYEIIVVDDGSKDQTFQVASSYAELHGADIVRVIRQVPNAGKGAAVRAGMLQSRGQYTLFADADGATKFSDLDQLMAQLHRTERNEFGVAIGSRKHLARAAVAKRKWYRNILMWGFHWAVAVLCVKGIQDTQCGFKLFTRKSAQYLFTNQHLPRWGFDVELLYLANYFGMPIVEMAVNWTEVPGSKLSIVGATITIAKDLVTIRSCYSLGFWRAQRPSLKS